MIRKMFAVDIEQMLVEQIKTGIYGAGQKLPPVRELATQLGVNKNTVVKAYESLGQKGYTESIQGNGTFVRGEPSGFLRDSETIWQDQLEQVFRIAKQAGIDRSELIREIGNCIEQVFGEGDPQVAFIECNAFDIETLGHKVKSLTGYNLYGMLLSDFLTRPQAISEEYDLLVTTFFHLGEVEQALDALTRERVVGIHATPTQDALLKIARLQGQVLGIVADLPRAAEWLLHIVQTYLPNVTVIQASLDDKTRLQAMLEKADAIVVTQSRYQSLLDYGPVVPVVPVALTITQESAEFLQSRLRILRPSRAFTESL
jgi:DNA-binding transcriptional regulator YhcF (GntR family)